jgi:6-phosphogluconolactonase
VANQDSDNIVVFDVDAQTGRLLASGQQIKAPSPVSLRFVTTR